MPGPLSHPKDGKTALNRQRGTLARWERNRAAAADLNRRPPGSMPVKKK